MSENGRTESPEGSRFRRAVLVFGIALLALAAVVIGLRLQSPALPQLVAGDYRDFKSGELNLEMLTTDRALLEEFFIHRGIDFETRVFDLATMRFDLEGGRIHTLADRPSVAFAYRGPDGEYLLCQMYPGRIEDLPWGATFREHDGIKFHIYRQGDLAMAFWREGSVICVLTSADVDSESLVQLAFGKAVDVMGDRGLSGFPRPRWRFPGNSLCLDQESIGASSLSSDGQQASSSGHRSHQYDPAFQAAVDDGFLTPAQALQRGRRDNCASRLATKHGLALAIAFAVADNRLTLAQALRKQRSPVGDPLASRERKESIRVGWMALGAPLVLFLGVFAWHVSLTESSTDASLSAPEVLTDAQGRVTRVMAKDPESVLDAYCAATNSDSPCKPSGLMKAAGAALGLRVGVFVDPAAAERLLAIPIRQNEATGLWFAGDGETPLGGLLAPHNAAASIERSQNDDSPQAGS